MNRIEPPTDPIAMVQIDLLILACRSLAMAIAVLAAAVPAAAQATRLTDDAMANIEAAAAM